MRCQYCHNPDTWARSGGTRRSPESLIAEFERNRPFYKHGGITVTGGEPLLQIDFLLELFTLAKRHGIHTCLDTAGSTYRPGESENNRKLDKLMEVTDLVLLDIKHMDPVRHKDLTGHENRDILEFAQYLDAWNVPVWIRHVVVPGITDQPEHLQQLGQFLAELHNVKALDVLPYHVMGVSKYWALGIDYPLEGIPAATQQQAEQAKEIIMTAYRESKGKKGKNCHSSTPI